MTRYPPVTVHLWDGGWVLPPWYVCQVSCRFTLVKASRDSSRVSWQEVVGMGSTHLSELAGIQGSITGWGRADN